MSKRKYNILIVNGTDINQPASGSGVVLKQILSTLPSDVFLDGINCCQDHIGGKINLKGKWIDFYIGDIWRKARLKNFIHFDSFMYGRSNRNKKLQEKIESMLKVKKYDLIYYHDTIAAKNIVNKFGVPSIVHLIDLHSKSYWYYFISEKKILNKFWYLRESVFSYLDEKRILKKVNKILLVNKKESDFANEIHKTNKFKNLNLGVDLDRLKIESKSYVVSNKNKIVYIGNMNYKPNKDGLLNFIEKYYKFLSKKDYELHVVGPYSENYEKLNENIYGHGFVDDLSLFLSKMDFGISMMVNGSGIKNKVFDYLSCGLPVITNSFSYENNFIDSEYIYVADTFKSMHNIVCNFKDIDRSLIRNSILKYNNFEISGSFWEIVKEVSDAN